MKILVAAIAMAIVALTQAATVDTLLARLDVYLAAYEPKLSELVADESMLQEVRGNARLRLDRKLESEVAFLALPQNVGWLGFRHVKAVDNRPVGLADASLTVALGTPGLEHARTLLTESAKHNLGLPRTTNLPNLPLEFLHRRNRQRLLARADGEETVRGIRTARLVFLERTTPTVIQNRDTGQDVPSVVRAWIDPRDGRLIRADVRTFASASANRPESSLSVEFAENKALGLLVPIEMRETFPAGKPLRGTSVASYTNFRRFTTSGRIVPQ
jgi:hypothetical protein